MRIIRDHTGLTDAWEAVHGKHASVSRQNDPKTAMTVMGVTVDSPMNTYTAGKKLDYFARMGLGKRLDYIFFRGPIGRKDRFKLRCKQTQVVLTDAVPNSSISFSDHFGVETVIEIDTPDGVLNEASESSISEESSLLLMRALTECYRHSSSRSRSELSISVICLFSLLALCIGSVWLTPSWLTPIYILFTIFLSWLGTTMLYSGFIYGNWERRALANVIEELELATDDNTQSASTVVGVGN